MVIRLIHTFAVITDVTVVDKTEGDRILQYNGDTADIYM